MASWSKAGAEQDLSEVTTSTIRMLDEDGQKGLLFAAIRACELNAIRNVLQVNRGLVQSKMYGYEGSDVFEIIKSKTKRCYFYTGQEKDGYFYPLHVATEAGHKNLTILLVRAGADVTAQDYRGLVAEERCTGNARHAFFELQGLKYEATERYVGKTDRAGKRHNQGVLYFKPEGYETTEKQLYRGSFKNDMYHGHGTLYWPGQDNIQYIGRFKAGLKHGRGIEFDEAGHKVYQGIFRDDKREGRGDEFADEIRIYKGEFSENLRHGFGVAYFDEGAKYFGRYEGGLMCGVGIYCHPNGDRFEGMFFSNKPDGPGSFYERDIYTNNFTGSHAVWQAGRKVKDTNFPFVPTSADLPDHDGKEIFSEIMNHAGKSDLDEGPLSPAPNSATANTATSLSLSDLQLLEEESEAEEGSDEEARTLTGTDSTSTPFNTTSNNAVHSSVATPSKAALQAQLQMQLLGGEGEESGADSPPPPPPSSKPPAGGAKQSSLLHGGNPNIDQHGRLIKKNFMYFDGDGCMNGISKGDVWKIQLGKYLKLPLKEAATLGLRLPPELLLAMHKQAHGGGEGGEGEEGEGEGHGTKEDDEDSEVEMEEVSGYHFMDCMPLFVSYVYVTSASKVFEDRLVNRGLHAEFPDFEAVYHIVIDAVDSYNEGWEKAFKDQELLKIEQAAGIVPTTNRSGLNSSQLVENKRKVFMTEKEKKEQLILKQRAELAIKKGTAELPIEVERRIEIDILQVLESELCKLMVDDEHSPDTPKGQGSKLPRSHAGAKVTKAHTPTNKAGHAAQQQAEQRNGNSAENKTARRLSHTKYKNGDRTYDAAKMNIEDLFDVFMDNGGNNQINVQFSDDGSDNGAEQSDEPLVSNEFADELLYIMRTAMSLS